MINFIIGIFIGAFLGVTTMALLNMAKDTEPPKQEKHEPAKLWTVGNICKWKGDTYFIYAWKQTNKIRRSQSSATVTTL